MRTANKSIKENSDKKEQILREFNGFQAQKQSSKKLFSPNSEQKTLNREELERLEVRLQNYIDQKIKEYITQHKGNLPSQRS